MGAWIVLILATLLVLAKIADEYR